jgi:hypothetical protein
MSQRAEKRVRFNSCGFKVCFGGRHMKMKIVKVKKNNIICAMRKYIFILSIQKRNLTSNSRKSDQR